MLHLLIELGLTEVHRLRDGFYGEAIQLALSCKLELFVLKLYYYVHDMNLKKYLYIEILLVIVGVGYVSMTALADNNTMVPPGRVTLDRAVASDQGVEITWLEADAGSFPIQNYVVERSHEHGAFQEVGRVEKDARSYQDGEGRAGDEYRVVAEDDQAPPNRSSDSEIVAAAVADPGSIPNVATDTAPTPPIASPVESHVPASTSPAVSSESQATALDTKKTDSLNGIEQALTTKNFEAAADQITQLQLSDRQTLALFNRLSPQRQTSLAQNCQQRSGALEADFHLLPESSQLNGLLAQAACDAIQDSAP